MLAEPWRTVTLFNPIVYLVSGFRWTFFGRGDVGIEFSLLFVSAMLLACLAVIGWVFRTGYRLKK
jgi:ABC-2 type transport system permease protein